MTTRQPRRTASGFTLIEAMAAMAVFMIGVLGFMGAMVAARGSTAWARRDMEATAIAQDLAGKIDLWDYTDPRLTPNTGAPCATDPADSVGALSRPGTSAYTTFVGCAHGESKLGGAAYMGRSTPTFPAGGATDTFTRLYVVREEDADGNVPATVNGGLRKRIWVLVAYTDGGLGRRVVSYQTKVQRGALQ